MADTKKIVVIDDDYEVVELVKAVLKSKGYHVFVAYDGEDGMKLITQERPDLAIVDLRMPGLSGLEVCRRVRRTPELAATPLLVISSSTAGMNKPDSFWASGLGSDDFLAKPFDPLSLLGRVEYLLRKDEYRSTTARVVSREGDRPADGGSGQYHSEPVLSPVEVVRSFVESWNTRDFGREYRCLAEEMTGGLTMGDYVQRRAQLYSDEDGTNTEHHVLDAEESISHNVATVACLREDLVKNSPRRKDERYTLKKTPHGWKIIAVRSRPIAFRID